MTGFYSIIRHDGVEMVPRLAACDARDALRQFREWLFENNPTGDIELYSSLNAEALRIRANTYTCREVQ